MKFSKKKIGLFLGPALFVLVMLFFNPENLNPEAKSILASTIWIAIWWITECVPISVTALLPIILFPLTGGLDIKSTTASYGHNLVFLFVGGFIIALAIENGNIEKIVLEDSATPPLEIVSNENNNRVIKTETVMKRESLGTNLSSSLSIEKFGLETLLFKKLESDRKFAKQLEDEKSELLHMMYTQKKLFERVDNNKFSFKNSNLFSKAKIYYIYLPIVLVYYIAT